MIDPNVAGMGASSADRTTREYVDDLWNEKPTFELFFCFLLLY